MTTRSSTWRTGRTGRTGRSGGSRGNIGARKPWALATLGLWLGLSLALTAARQDLFAQGGAATSASAGLVPEGFGSRKQDEIAVKLQNVGLAVKAIPLDEAILRLLAPDSYRALRGIRESRAKQLGAIAARVGVPRVQAWYVTYYTLEPGEARYEPMDVVLRSAGRDFRPLDVIAVTPGFGEGRVAQRQQQSAIFAYDPTVDLSQPITVLAAGQQSNGWTETLSLLDAERTAVWSRASAATPKKP